MDYFNKAGIDFINAPECNDGQQIGVFRMKTGKYTVAQSLHPWRVATALNSPEFCDVTERGEIYRVIGVKPITEERTLASVTKKFTDKVGADNVISLAV